MDPKQSKWVRVPRPSEARRPVYGEFTRDYTIEKSYGDKGKIMLFVGVRGSGPPLVEYVPGSIYLYPADEAANTALFAWANNKLWNTWDLDDYFNRMFSGTPDQAL